MASSGPQHLKVFVSSPGDVPEERAVARQMLATLQNDARWAGLFTFQPVMWDDPQAPAPLEANVTPQASVNWYKGRPAECQLTVVILAGRIGSRPDLFRPDGSQYESGTVWEYEDAAMAGRTVWVFHRDPPPIIDVDDPARPDKEAQRAGIRHFIATLTAGGKGGCEAYADTADFKTKLDGRLNTFLRSLSDRSTAEPEPTPAPPAAPYLIPEPTRGHDIVGRRHLLDTLWADIARGQNCSLVFLAGVGKTTVALELVREKARILEKFEGVLWADLGKRPEWVEQLRRWAEALGVAPDVMRNVASVEDWKKVVKDAIGARRLLIVLDDVWAVKDAREFAGLGPKCVTLITTRLRQVAAELSRQDQVWEVEELDEACGLALLESIAPHAVEADPAGAREMVAAVQGLPLALVLVGKYLKRESGERDPDRIAEAFATLQEAGQRLTLRSSEAGGDERTLEEIIDVSYGALATDAARQALEHLAIFRPKPHTFSKAMALEICGTDRTLLFQLSDMGLVEHAGGGEYTMHRVIAEYARRKLPLTEAEDLNRKALAWYSAKLEEAIDEDPAAYLGWYRYEQPDWQALKDAWLYHLAASGDTVGSTLAFLRVYFEAFWWWGYYQRFPFCERLVREWLQRDIGTAQRAVLQQLSQFQDSYPAGYEKRGRAQDWRQVERSLVGLRQALGLDGEADRIRGEDARRVRGFTDFLLAECSGYGRGERALALARYAAAHDLFRDDGEPWVPAWIWFYVAQFHLDQADPAGATEYARRGLAEADEATPLAQRDPELLANLYRVLGDVALEQGDVGGCARHYRRAAFYAFAFQAIPEPADTYTVAFYREITGRIRDRLMDQGAAADPSGLELMRALRAYWDPWWALHPILEPDLGQAMEAGDKAALEAYLFPAAPSEERVITEAKTFAEAVLGVVAALRAAAEIADDPA